MLVIASNMVTMMLQHYGQSHEMSKVLDILLKMITVGVNNGMRLSSCVDGTWDRPRLTERGTLRKERA